MISAFYGHVEVVALLCERGANIEARDHVSIIMNIVYGFVCMYIILFICGFL